MSPPAITLLTLMIIITCFLLFVNFMEKWEKSRHHRPR